MDRINLFYKAQEFRIAKFNTDDDAQRHFFNSKEIEARRENKILWDELAHFVNTGEILGKHKAFIYEQTLKKFSELDNSVLVKKFHLIPNYRFKANQSLGKTNDPNKMAKINARIEKYNIEEKAIKTLLKIF